MGLGEQLRRQLEERSAVRAPEVNAAYLEGIARVRAAGVADRSLGVDDPAPMFTLPDATGTPVALADLLARGPVLISFYRGGWCPYCNLELRAYQELLPELAAVGTTLVAISPQTPDASLTTAEKQELTFPVLSDVGNVVADAFGIVHEVDPAVRAIYERTGHDLPGRNAQEPDRVALPLPATYLIDTAATIRFAFVSPDYTQRAEPQDVLDVARGLRT